MKIRALVPWFGSKRTLAPEIVRELGDHQAYWEPFCGSMAVLLAKAPCAMETVNDLHGDLHNLAVCVADRDLGPKLYRALRRTLMVENTFADAVERWKASVLAGPCEPPELQRAQDFFVSSWMGRNGVAGIQSYNQGYCLRFSKNGGHAATRFVSVIESIPQWRRRLRVVTILNRDGFDLLPRIEDARGVSIYVDPPYLVKGAKYVHDFEAQDHQRLAAMLGRFKKTRVVVSYYDHERLDGLYAGWTKRHLKANKALANQSPRKTSGAVKAPEVLLINGPSLVEGALF